MNFAITNCVRENPRERYARSVPSCCSHAMASPANMNAKMGIRTQNRIWQEKRANIRPSQSLTGSEIIFCMIYGIPFTIPPAASENLFWNFQ